PLLSSSRRSVCLVTAILLLFCFLYIFAPPKYLHSFPTRRSSDLALRRAGGAGRPRRPGRARGGARHRARRSRARSRRGRRSRCGDRKSTRLNSSHVSISYAVFCLKKKRNTAS